jgi:hypothetical protein
MRQSRLFPDVLATSLLFLAACGSDNDIHAGSESLSYSFDLNGCKTGQQTFDSKDAMCAGLKDDARNNGCAYSMRKDEFERRGCSGLF